MFFFHFPSVFLYFNSPEVESLSFPQFTVNISMYHCHISTFISYRGPASLQCTIHRHSHTHAEHMSAFTRTHKHTSIYVCAHANHAHIALDNLLCHFWESIHHADKKEYENKHKCNSACTHTLKLLNTVHHSALCLITNGKFNSSHCSSWMTFHIEKKGYISWY